MLYWLGQITLEAPPSPRSAGACSSCLRDRYASPHANGSACARRPGSSQGMTPVRLEQVELVAVPHTESAEPDSVAGRHISRVSRLKLLQQGLLDRDAVNLAGRHVQARRVPGAMVGDLVAQQPGYEPSGLGSRLGPLLTSPLAEPRLVPNKEPGSVQPAKSDSDRAQLRGVRSERVGPTAAAAVSLAALRWKRCAPRARPASRRAARARPRPACARESVRLRTSGSVDR